MKGLAKLIGVLMSVCWIAAPIKLHSQSKAEFPLAGLKDQQERGQGVYLQRCSLCHIPDESKILRSSAKRLGNDLSGLMKESGGKKESEVREIILKGTARMPGFQYSLSSKELEDLVAYLKVL